MTTLTTFSNDKQFLLDLLREIRDGKTQLPDFQRGWVWDDENVRSLLASISLSYPIGAVMLLETGNADVSFKPRPVEGIVLEDQLEPDQLILDGQQRLTSLFQALLLGKSVSTRDARRKPIRRWYYLDIAKSLDPFMDREEAIVGLPEDRKVRNFRGQLLADYSTKDKEYEHGLFPLSEIFDHAAWRRGHNRYYRNDEDRLDQFDRFEEELVDTFKQYQIPLIVLGKRTPKEAVCQVFEKVNTGGVSLTVFELLTATYAADDYSLREDWEGTKDPQGRKTSLGRKDKLREQNLLNSIESTDFLQAVTLLAAYERKTHDLDRAISCKRKDILRLTLDEYLAWAEPATLGFKNAAKLLRSQKVFSARDLPYRTQLVPLAAILAALGEEAETDGVRAKLARWYWCGVFGELYGSAVESRFARDLPEVLAWVHGDSEPETVASANFASARLLNLRSRNSAAYKGLHSLLLRDGALDFRTGEPIDTQMYFDDKVDIHHIFPQNWSKKQSIEPKRFDSIINKTPLAARTNRKLGGNAPSIYLKRIEKDAGISEERMEEILRSHVIEPEALRTDDFDAFFKSREQILLDLIENVMGKPIARDAFEDEEEVVLEYEEEAV